MVNYLTLTFNLNKWGSIMEFIKFVKLATLVYNDTYP